MCWVSALNAYAVDYFLGRCHASRSCLVSRYSSRSAFSQVVTSLFVGRWPSHVQLVARLATRSRNRPRQGSSSENRASVSDLALPPIPVHPSLTKASRSEGHPGVISRCISKVLSFFTGISYLMTICDKGNSLCLRRGNVNRPSVAAMQWHPPCLEVAQKQLPGLSVNNAPRVPRHRNDASRELWHGTQCRVRDEQNLIWSLYPLVGCPGSGSTS